MAGLQLNGISKRYKKETVVDNVSLDIASGETLVLFGPSGAGKTVLLRMIAGVVEPDQGQIIIDGHDMSGVEAEDRGVGMAFQNFALFPHMSAFENIASPLTVDKRPADAVRSGVDKVARLLKIDHVLSHRPRELSNGQKQRTALARALAGSPPLLLLDDPLRNVDAKLRFEMRLELPQLLSEQGATVLYVTQDYKEAMALGDRIAVLSEGSIVQLGTPAQIYQYPASVEIARLFGDPAVNLFHVQAQRDDQGTFVTLSGRRLALNANTEIPEGMALILGVRPENFQFVSDAGSDVIPVFIEAETPLNEKIVTLAMTEGGREILISRPANTGAPGEGHCHIQIKQGAMLVFDQASGALITTSNQQSDGSSLSTDTVAASAELEASA